MASVTITNASGGNTTFSYDNVQANFRGWGDSVGESFANSAKKQVYDFNNAHNEVWSKIGGFPKVNPKDFEYQSLADRIYRLEA